MKNVISSLSNPQMKNLTLLQKKAKAREEQSLFVIEGLKMFEDAREANILVKAFVAQSLYEELVGSDASYFIDMEYEIVKDAILKEISDTMSPQGIVGTVRKIKYSLTDIISTPSAFLLLLEDIRDPGNLGTILRTAEGAGITGVIFNDTCVDIYNPKVIRATMGSIYRVPFYQTGDFFDVISDMKKLGIRIYAAHLQGEPYDTEGNFLSKCAFLIGNEANGLSERASSMADSLVKIPMKGKVESLNAAVAASILMYEVARQRRKY